MIREIGGELSVIKKYSLEVVRQKFDSFLKRNRKTLEIESGKFLKKIKLVWIFEENQIKNLFGKLGKKNEKRILKENEEKITSRNLKHWRKIYWTKKNCEHFWEVEKENFWKCKLFKKCIWETLREIFINVKFCKIHNSLMVCEK